MLLCRDAASAAALFVLAGGPRVADGGALIMTEKVKLISATFEPAFEKFLFHWDLNRVRVKSFSKPRWKRAPPEEAVICSGLHMHNDPF